MAEHYNDFILKQKDLGSSGYGLLDPQLDHILAVQSACLKADLWDEARGLTWSLDGYLDLQGHWVERRRSAESGLVAARAQEDRYDEASSLNLLGLAYADLGDARKAIENYEQQLKITQVIGDRRGEGNALWNMSLALDSLGKRAEAVKLAEEALAIYEQIESPYAERVQRQLAEWQE